MNQTRSFFTAGLMIGLLAACILGALVIRPKTSAGPDVGARGIVLKLAHGLDEAHPVHQAMTLMKQRLEELTGGKATIDLYS
ncbi:MAG: TRAP transporter substrate-binding protein, partial [Kiritimatiellae bacterium]|nr:TRAP transporter substrate-binding protein [Kiritimatiellia bacterium]